MLKIPKNISAFRLFIFSILQNLRNIRIFWKWPKKELSSKNPQYLRQLPAELIDESLRFLSHKKCLELSKSSKSYHLANLAEYRAKRFPPKLANPAFVNAKKNTWKQKLLLYFGLVTLEEHSQLREEHNQLQEEHYLLKEKQDLMEDYIGKLVSALQNGGIDVPSFSPMPSSSNNDQPSAQGSSSSYAKADEIPKKQRIQKKKRFYGSK